VAFGHGASFPVAAQLGKTTALARLLAGLDGVSFDGLAAVLVFFVVSGFCIHYAPATGAPFNPLAFWTRRILRISGPLVAALTLAWWLGPAETGALAAVTWSVFCELIYYALYPLLRVGFRRFGLGRLLLLSTLLSAVLIAVGWSVPYYWGFGIGLTWLAALPGWLLGCWLAERVAARRQAPSLPGGIWTWRCAVWIYSAVAMAIFFHAPIRLSFPVLLFPFQFLACGWIWAEIDHFERSGVSRTLEWCGRWSYSLYLVHNIAIAKTPIAPSAALWTWLLRLAVIVGGSLAFYAIFEAPSHWIARQASRKVATLVRARTAQPSVQPAA
jgi:peptidoglycan/LPS O-acetylase OafA/YrhL